MGDDKWDARGVQSGLEQLLRISHQRMDNEYMSALRQHSLMAVADPN